MPEPRHRSLRECILWLVCACLCMGFAAVRAQTTAQPPSLMLAQVWRSGLPLKDYWVSEKLDGVRGYWNGRQLVSRGGQRIAAPEWFVRDWPATPMDGELWAGRGRFAHAQSTTAQAIPDDQAWRQMRFMVFDLPAAPGSFDQRLPLLQRTVGAIAQDWVQMVEQRKLGSEAELQQWLSTVIKGGGEGLMLHKGSAPYRSGRSDDLLKLKPFDDAEARVIGYRSGRGQWQGMTGALLVQTPDGRQFSLGSGLTAQMRKSPPPLGSWVTYRPRACMKKAGCHALPALCGCAASWAFSPSRQARDSQRHRCLRPSSMRLNPTTSVATAVASPGRARPATRF